MKAMALRSPCAIEQNPLELVDLPVPEPASREILIKVEFCGICRTDLHVVEGDLPPVTPHIVPRHEVVGRVVKNGVGSGKFAIGARVGAAWLYASCGVCRYCLRGDENLCESPLFTGYHKNGGFAEYIVAREQFVYALDRGGTLAIAGIYLSAIPEISYDWELFLERTLCSVTANTRKDGIELLRLAAEIPIVTHTELFPLEEANVALRKLKKDSINGAGVPQIARDP